MPAVTLSEAAQALGFKSRSTLYRLRDAGDLADYLRPPSSPGGAQLLELTPPARPPLAEHVARLIRPQITNADRRTRRPRPDPRWGVVAGLLSEALADCGGLSLCDAEAQAIAAALPAAMAEAFEAQGLELLRLGLADAGYGWRVGDGAPANPEAEREWWNEWGRWEPGEALEDGPFWASVGGIAGGMMGPPFHGMSGPTAAELFRQMSDAIDEVGRGARWDAARWDAASARMLLADPDVSGGAEPLSLPELQRLAAGGLLPPDLQAETEAALERYRANDQQQQQAGEALPVGAGN